MHVHGPTTRLRRTAVALAAAAVVLLPLSGCQSASTTPAGERPAECDGVDLTRVGYSPYSNTGGYFPLVEKGLEGVLSDCGIDVVTSDPDGESGEQVSGIENLVAAGAKAVIVCPTDPKAISPVARRLTGQDVLVVGLATDIPEADVVFNLDDRAFGELEGESAGGWLAANRVDEVPTVAILHQDSGGEPLIARHEGVIAGIDAVLGEGKWTLVSEVEAYQEDTGNAQTSTVLQAHPDLDLIVGLNDSSALGAISAVKASGRTPGEDVGIVTGGEDARILQGVLSGDVVSTVGLFPLQQGEIIARAVLELASGGEVEREQIVPVELVTAENAQGILDSLG
ncbi:sugar ABC transporter substrate-binding protein [Rathayibacter sp. VKM Ac-2856]|uniref:sugar ABC transporter substrate-binding protein n=1 Tax=unclassified Rathayibacter TaxID=2609250 RepID=UPI001562FDB3|nr:MULTISPECIES: sugar ABC transporter substrate-binding protein [unclassified Rathayibacter]NQX04485.1 sugar ABC transporter substrate-binding protein [Rathayibacter sp. VKM Ac-2858]NQX19654.1 sugar ABC transporter substrate-binding protein [Rathayibacter sp. VKM Ac-2856]